MANNDVDWDLEEQEGLVEQYIKLMPYILRDFVHKEDVKNMILAFQRDPSGLLSEVLSDAEGIRTAIDYKRVLDSGDDITNKIKPVIKL